MRLRRIAISVGTAVLGVVVGLLGSLSGTTASAAILDRGELEPVPVLYSCDPVYCHNSDWDPIEIQECAKGIMKSCTSTVQTDCDYICHAHT